MRLLALQPYDAASHRAFLEGWRVHSRHEIDVLSLPGRHFKWRVRQAPVELAKQIEARVAAGQRWDALWCTSMLDLAALRGLCSNAAKLPGAIYFHENQLTYPTRYADQRDVHYGLTNMTSALATIASHPRNGSIGPPPCVWWNSAYNRDSFLDALAELLQSMPDYPMPETVEAIRAASKVLYPGIDTTDSAEPRDRDQPPVLLWAARWEYDKGPELFFDALDVLVHRGVLFRLSVIGEQFAEWPACFKQAQERFAERIVRWGYQPTRGAYEDALREADLVVSTSKHEFFGIAVAEAVSAGCMPVLPKTLAYPEVWGDTAVYHNQTAEGVADAIERALSLQDDPELIQQAAEPYAWSRIAPRLDDAIESLVSSG